VDVICHFSVIFDIQNYTLPVVSYGCETGLFTLRETRRLRVFQNRVLRRIFESRRVEVTGVWRKMLIENFIDL
jgi:hypothetical protein